MDEKKCKNCIYFKTHYSDSKSGSCHRNPPQIVYEHNMACLASLFPQVGVEDYCGEFKSEKMIQELGDLIIKALSEGIGDKDV